MVADGGFGVGTNNQVTDFIEFKDALYVATKIPKGTAQVWRSMVQVVRAGSGNSMSYIVFLLHSKSSCGAVRIVPAAGSGPEFRPALPVAHLRTGRPA